MESACVRQTQLPHASRLFEDFTYHFDQVKQFYAHAPGDPEEMKRAAAEIHFPDERRAALVAALRHSNPNSRSLELLAEPGTVAVVTGQQVGLFSGPCYTIYKALTAVKIAQQLTAQGLKAVPVFWLATEDHDFAEVDHAWTFDAGHQPVLLRATGEISGQQPVGHAPLTSLPIDELRQALRGFPFGDEVVDLVASAYRPGCTMGQSFHALVRELLARFDLIYIDPLDEGIRRIGAPLLKDAIAAGDDLKRLLLARNKELEAAGYHAQVHVEPQTSLVFLLEGGRRITLKKQNGEYVSKERSYSAEELAERADHLSPNALLRPVMQDYVLPTVTYVGGPAELAYLAQAETIYRRLLGRMPVVVHRAGFTLLDQRAKKLLGRYQLDWPVVYGGEDSIREAISRRLVPPSLEGAFHGATQAVETAVDRLGKELAGFDSTLAAALEKSRAKMIWQLTKIEGKTAREAFRRSERAAADARFLTGLLYPHKHLQERFYTILPFLATHGFDLIGQLYENLRLECPDHQILVV